FPRLPARRWTDGAFLFEDAPELLPHILDARRPAVLARPGGCGAAQAVQGAVAHGLGTLRAERRGPLARGFAGGARLSLAIQLLVAQAVSMAVLRARHMGKRDLLEPARQHLRLVIEVAQVLVLDAVLAVHLLDEQFAVRTNGNPAGTQLGRAL